MPVLLRNKETLSIYLVSFNLKAKRCSFWKFEAMGRKKSLRGIFQKQMNLWEKLKYMSYLLSY